MPEMLATTKTGYEVSTTMKIAQPDVNWPDTEKELPQLPALANYYFQAEKLEKYGYALSDLLCWLDGFRAAGGVYSPQTQETLRDLNCAIKSVQQKQACGESYAHTTKKDKPNE